MSPLDVRMFLREELRRVLNVTNLILEMNGGLDRESMVNVNQLIENVLALLAPQLEKQEITVTKSLTSVEERYGNPLTLKQAFFNIIMNAIEAMPDGGELTVSSSLDDSWSHIEISDNGVGIPKRFLGDIFGKGFSTRGQIDGILPPKK